ncbi:MAG: hypothetical protein ACFB5Z_15190, partial [Elainellaceae cyanobacterium]
MDVFYAGPQVELLRQTFLDLFSVAARDLVAQTFLELFFVAARELVAQTFLELFFMAASQATCNILKLLIGKFSVLGFLDVFAHN